MSERLISYQSPLLKNLEMKRRQKMRFFLHRSISMEWFQRLILLGASPIRVGLVLRFKMILEGKDAITLTTRGLSDFGITRQQKWKGLKALREEGLVGIESRPGKNPKVTLIDPPLPKKEVQ